MKKANVVLTIVCLGFLGSNAMAEKASLPPGSYTATCECTASTSKLLAGTSVSCKCLDHDKKRQNTSILYNKECREKGQLQNCDGKLVCAEKCPRKKVFGIF